MHNRSGRSTSLTYRTNHKSTRQQPLQGTCTASYKQLLGVHMSRRTLLATQD